ncbi:hypothetical protein KEM55_001411 [Ascosphaera atra]|nr:hypothetical protein KEM55_001411 [Ascosphaera atra]
MATSFTPTITPTSKERKYDRQLRLWAASGQSALEQARVLLINTTEPLDSLGSLPSGVAGVETLKNLVLPGVGGFTIVDHAIVKEEDLGVNFFLEDTSLGKNRGEETCRLLKELNPDVEGDCDARASTALSAYNSLQSTPSSKPTPQQTQSKTYTSRTPGLNSRTKRINYEPARAEATAPSP